MNPVRRLGAAARAELGPLIEEVSHFGKEPQPRGVGWAHVSGAALLALFVVQIVTGILLALYYAPSVESAHESVRYIEDEVRFGSFIRGLHHWSASAIVVGLALHVTLAVLWGAYKPPRRLLWWVGLLLLGLALGSGYTGYLLPWDQKAYFGTRVGTGIPGTVPVVGPWILGLLRGGEDVGQLTLTRFYAFHAVAIPIGLVLAIFLHLWLIRRLGITAPWTKVGDERAAPRVEPFAPYQMARDSIASLAAVGIVAALALTLGAELGERADPSRGDYVPRPDWYFLGLQHLLRLFPGRLQFMATAVLPTLGALFLLVLPYLDRSAERAIRKRKGVVAAYLLFASTIVALTLLGYRAVKTEEAAMAGRTTGAGETLPALPPHGDDPPPPPDDVERGRRLYGVLKCGSCHPDSGAPKDFAPALGLEGSRARTDWIASYLKDPYRIYYAKEHLRPEARMPDFRLSPDEAVALAAFLSTRTDDSLVPRGRWRAEDPTPERIERGKVLFEDELCSTCHTIGEAGGQFGPDLTHAAARLQPDYIAALLADPHRINPESQMLPLDLTEEQIRSLVSFLLSNR